METALSLALSLLLVSSCSGQSYCNGKICPKYEVVEENQIFEVRKYASTTWIRTEIKDKSNDAFLSASGRLKAFVGDQTELRKTWPVLINHTKDDQLWLNWFVPPGKTVPQESEAVEIFVLPKSTFNVRTFGGIPSISAGESVAHLMLAALRSNCSDVKLLEYSGAGYESFWSLTHHNEVWINQIPVC